MNKKKKKEKRKVYETGNNAVLHHLVSSSVIPLCNTARIMRIVATIKKGRETRETKG